MTTPEASAVTFVDENSSHCVSVVIPSRDGRQTLRRALDSLIPGARWIREVILVFSNSPEAFQAYAYELLKEYEPHFGVCLIDSGAQSNGAIARNAGIQAAVAPLVALLDDDDEWFPAKLPLYLDVVAGERLTGDFVLFSQVVSCLDDRTEWLLFPSIRYRGEPIADFVFEPRGGAQTSSLLLPTGLAQRVGFDPSLVRHQDYDFCMRLEEAGARFHAIDRPLSFWYRRGSSVEKGSTFDYCADWIRSNGGRVSRRAYVAYVGKELLAATRASGLWRRYAQFQREHLTLVERAGLLRRLAGRAVHAALRRLLPVRGGPYRPR